MVDTISLFSKIFLCMSECMCVKCVFAVYLRQNAYMVRLCDTVQVSITSENKLYFKDNSRFSITIPCF